MVGFVYERYLTPTVTSVTPAYASPILRTEITVAGGSFGAAGGNRVTIGTHDCVIVTESASEITCELEGGQQGDYQLTVEVIGMGDAIYPASFPISFDISSVTPSFGSTEGGTYITIKGRGFSLNATQNVIHINSLGYICETIDIPDQETIVCMTARMDSGLTENTAYNVVVIGRG
jgi:hypothetical protein